MDNELMGCVICKSKEVEVNFTVRSFTTNRGQSYNLCGLCASSAWTGNSNVLVNHQHTVFCKPKTPNEFKKDFKNEINLNSHSSWCEFNLS